MKTLFVWKYVNGATDSYHDGGGVVVVADSLEAAREAIKEECTLSCGALTEDPDYTTQVEAQESKIFVFPDAGCC